jgi:hypothetical protein
MDDKDQTQIRPLDSSAAQNTARSRRKQQPDRSASDQQAAQFSQATASLAGQAETALPTQTAVSAQPAQPVQNGGQVRQARGRSARQVTKPQPQPPQPILFSEREEVVLLEDPLFSSAARREPWPRTRRWLRSRTGRVVIPVLTLLIGLAIGLTSVIWYGLSGEGALVLVAPPAQGNLVIDANRSFVTQLVRNNLADAGLPGEVRNVTVTLKHGAELIVQGDDVYSVMFVTITKHFTINLQPYVRSCMVQVRITHADLSGIPVTTFAQSFQGKINQQLAQKPSGLPAGFTYCTVGVTTEPGGMYVTYQATPVK